MKKNFIEKLNQIWIFYRGLNGEDTNTLQLSISSLSVIFISIIKILLGIFLKSTIWLFSGFYAGSLAVTRFLFLKDIVTGATTEKKNKTSFVTSVILMISAFFFDICAMFRQFQGNLGKPLPVWLVIPISIYFFISFILAINGLLRTRKNKSLSFYAFRAICISGALMNMVLLQRMVLSITAIPTELIVFINSIFSYFIGGTILLSALILMIRSIFTIQKI